MRQTSEYKSVTGPRNLAWAMLYAICMVAVTVGMWQARRCALRDYATAEAQQEWEDWRGEVERLGAAEGPVQFKDKPRSPAPPALLLMQDYFAVCVVFAVTLSSVLFATTMFLVRGVMASPGGPVRDV